LVKNPEDKDVQYWLLRSLFFSGCLAEEASQLDDALDWYEQAAAIQTELELRESDSYILTSLYIRPRNLYWRFKQAGLAAHEKRSRHVSQKIRRYLDASPLGLDTLGRFIREHALNQGSAFEDKGIRQAHEQFVAEWIAISVGLLSPFRSSSVAATYDRDPKAGAVAVMSAIRDRCSKLGLAETTVPAAINFVREEAMGLASEQRRLGRLDDAHTTVARLMVLARQLVQEYPNSAYSHRVLSEAYDQIKKNAFETNDDKPILEALGKAVEAAKQSLALDPDWLETRRHLDKLAGQLANIKADRNAPVPSLP
jgi:hypothetical protein